METLIQNNIGRSRRRGVLTMYVIVLTCLTIFKCLKIKRSWLYLDICTLKVLDNPNLPPKKASLWYVDLNGPFVEMAVILWGKCKDKTQCYSRKKEYWFFVQNMWIFCEFVTFNFIILTKFLIKNIPAVMRTL